MEAFKEILDYQDKKTGARIPLKYPKIRLMGKEMEDGTEAVFQCIKPIDKRTVRQYIFHSMFAKYGGTEDRFVVLELSGQALEELQLKNVGVGDIFRVRKEWILNSKSGMKFPIIKVEVENRVTNPSYDTPRTSINPPNLKDNSKEVVTPPPQENVGFKTPLNEFEKRFVEGYRTNVQVSEQTLNHFIGTYVMNFSEKVAENLKKIYEEYVK